MLLDTCALLWLAHDQSRLSGGTLDQINEAAVVSVSAISGFEIGQKVKSGKLLLPVQPKDWFDGVLKHHDLEVVPLDLDICLKATELPMIHKDPCDRFIIATALLKNLPVITADDRFEEYGITVLR